MEKVRAGHLGCVLISGGALESQEPIPVRRTLEFATPGRRWPRGIEGDHPGAEEQGCQVSVPRSAEIPLNNGRP